MNWPNNYRLVSDALIADISLPEEIAGLTSLRRDPRKDEIKPDCYQGKVLETGGQCRWVKPGDAIVFTRWQYSQSDVDEARICLREVDLVVVNNQCVNGFIAVKLYEPFKKTELIAMPKRERPKNYWGQVISLSKDSKNVETKDLKEGDIIFFQAMDDYQYRVGAYTLVFKDIPDVVVLKMEEARTLSVV